ncbi:serine hydrolase [Deinococcus aestuarii]|uniref:serine hydrolase n=1 Tax=Deinococcus aestuarii TaxID=2774531 RepID=UPI001C0BB3DB|nr:serine hydrolase [Deinococcus aestuarii]
MRKFLLALVLLPGCARAQGGDPLAPLLDFARRQPGDVAVVTHAVRPDGTPDPARHRLTWNAARPMPLASTRKIVLLAAYARAVEAGRLDPHTPVRLSEWEASYVPGIDGGAHPASLRALDIPADAQGRARDGSRTVPLDTLAQFMIETSDNAAADLILSRLGPGAIPGTVRALGLTGQEDFGPVLGMVGNWAAPDALNVYAGQPLATRVARDWAKADDLSRDAEARRNLTRLPSWPAAAEQARLADATDPRGTANDFAGLMARVLTGAGLGKTELEVMRRHLGWPLRVNPDNAQAFTALYAKGGSLTGVLTNTFALAPRVGPRAGERLVVSVFLRRIPPDEYARLTQNLEGAMLSVALLPGEAQRLLGALQSR